jgi:hypothetical protein
MLAEDEGCWVLDPWSSSMDKVKWEADDEASSCGPPAKGWIRVSMVVC